MIDAYGPGSVVRSESFWTRVMRHSRMLVKMGPKELRGYFEGQLQRRISPRLAHLLPGNKLQRRLFVTAAQGRRAFQSYVPSHFDGRIVVVRADVVLDWLRVTDTSGACGWGNICSEVDVVCMACDHLAMFREPHMSELGAHVDRLLGKAG